MTISAIVKLAQRDSRFFAFLRHQFPKILPDDVRDLIQRVHEEFRKREASGTFDLLNAGLRGDELQTRLESDFLSTLRFRAFDWGEARSTSEILSPDLDRRSDPDAASDGLPPSECGYGSHGEPNRDKDDSDGGRLLDAVHLDPAQLDKLVKMMGESDSGHCGHGRPTPLDFERFIRCHALRATRIQPRDDVAKAVGHIFASTELLAAAAEIMVTKMNAGQRRAYFLFQIGLKAHRGREVLGLGPERSNCLDSQLSQAKTVLKKHMSG